MKNKIRMAVALVALTAVSGCWGREDDAGTTETAIGDVILGSADAPVEIIEYASVTCSHCRAFHTAILPTLRQRFIDTGKARFIVREFPTPPQALAVAGSALARCAGADKYHDVLDDLFDRQYELLDSASKGGALEVLNDIGAAHGLTQEMVTQCWANREILENVDAVVKEALEKGVRGTPTIFINGEQLEPEDIRIDTITAKIEKLLEEESAK